MFVLLENFITYFFPAAIQSPSIAADILYVQWREMLRDVPNSVTKSNFKLSCDHAILGLHVIDFILNKSYNTLDLTLCNTSRVAHSAL